LKKQSKRRGSQDEKGEHCTRESFADAGRGQKTKIEHKGKDRWERNFGREKPWEDQKPKRHSIEMPYDLEERKGEVHGRQIICACRFSF